MLTIAEKIVLDASEKDDFAAIRDYSYAIRIDKKLPQAFMERGIRYRKTGWYRLAIIDLSTAIQKRNKLYYPRCFLERGKIYLRLKKYKEANSDFSKLCKISPHQISEEGNQKAILYREITNIFLKKPCINVKDIDLIDGKFCISEIYLANERRYLIGLKHSLKKNYDIAINYFNLIILEDPEFFKRNIDYYDLLPLKMKLIFKTQFHI